MLCCKNARKIERFSLNIGKNHIVLNYEGVITDK